MRSKRVRAWYILVHEKQKFFITFCTQLRTTYCCPSLSSYPPPSYFPIEMALLTGKIHTTQMSFVYFIADSRTERNVFPVKGQGLASPCTFWLHEPKYQTSPREVKFLD